MDEAYIKVRGQWVYLCRAVDKSGQTVDFFLSPKRDVNAAKSFLRRAMKNTRKPAKITLDTYAASHRAVREMKEDGDFRGVRIKYLLAQGHKYWMGASSAPLPCGSLWQCLSALSSPGSVLMTA
jgi:transposase-like protein